MCYLNMVQTNPLLSLHPPGMVIDALLLLFGSPVPDFVHSILKPECTVILPDTSGISIYPLYVSGKDYLNGNTAAYVVDSTVLLRNIVPAIIVGTFEPSGNITPVGPNLTLGDKYK